MTDTKEQVKHTPTPWAVGANPFTVRGHSRKIEVCAMTNAVDGMANARFIVRACNSHEELVGALRSVGEELERTRRGTYTWALEKALQQARTALANAGEAL